MLRDAWAQISLVSTPDILIRSGVSCGTMQGLTSSRTFGEQNEDQEDQPTLIFGAPYLILFGNEDISCCATLTLRH